MAAPRGPPPVPHQARAPYLPLTPTVPEPSMFFPSSRSFSAPSNPGSANSSLGPPCPRPPMPAAAPSHHLLRPQSEFSRVFHQVGLFFLMTDCSTLLIFSDGGDCFPPRVGHCSLRTAGETCAVQHFRCTRAQ